MKVAYWSERTGTEAQRAKPRHSRDVRASEGTAEQRAAAEAEVPGSKRKRSSCPVPVILTTQEAEIRRISVQSQPGLTVLETLSGKNPTQKGLQSGSRC
jgi:hypothetical protein